MRTTREIQSELLLIRCRTGDATAFTDLTRLWERRLFYYIRRIVASEEDAWDALQEVWLRVWRRVGSIRDASAFRSWLYAVAHNTAVSPVRHDARMEAAHDSIPEPAAGEAPTFQNDAAERIHRGLDRVAPQQRQIFTLFFLEEFSQAEIAVILGVPVGTVKSRLFHAKHALRNVLDSEHER